MSKFIARQSVILSDYESHRSLSFQFYKQGVIIKSRQDQVNNKESGGSPNHFSSLIVSHLENDEAIKLRDRLLARYPIEQAKVNVNINQYMTFRLTDTGEQILADHNNATRAQHPSLRNYSAGKVENGVCSMLLWEVMSIFGPHLHLTAEPPFKGCLIAVEGVGA